jgi:hypothetical protein
MRAEMDALRNDKKELSQKASCIAHCTPGSARLGGRACVWMTPRVRQLQMVQKRAEALEGRLSMFSKGAAARAAGFGLLHWC